MVSQAEVDQYLDVPIHHSTHTTNVLYTMGSQSNCLFPMDQSCSRQGLCIGKVGEHSCTIGMSLTISCTENSHLQGHTNNLMQRRQLPSVLSVLLQYWIPCTVLDSLHSATLRSGTTLCIADMEGLLAATGCRNQAGQGEWHIQ